MEGSTKFSGIGCWQLGVKGSCAREITALHYRGELGQWSLGSGLCSAGLDCGIHFVYFTHLSSVDGVVQVTAVILWCDVKENVCNMFV